MNFRTWSALGSVAPTDLGGARLALHYGAQLLSAAAYAVLPMREDHSHTNLSWTPDLPGFRGRTLASGQRVFLDTARMRVGLLDERGGEAGAFELEGRTLEQAFAELSAVLRRADEDVPEEGLKLPDYDLPDSPLAQSETFFVVRPALEELTHWFHDADVVLSRLAGTHLGGAEVRGWPHHFDLAALRTLDQDRDPESARSVGAGFSPGDGTYAEPYFYVSPWPYPDAGELPELPSGAHWHTAGFTSAILLGSAVVLAGDAGAQQRTVEEFLLSAVTSSLALLEN